jgi:hypothetical protein
MRDEDDHVYDSADEYDDGQYEEEFEEYPYNDDEDPEDYEGEEYSDDDDD